MKAKNNLTIVLIVILVLTLATWFVSQFIQPILPDYINQNLLLFIAALSGVSTVLSNLNDIIDLFHKDNGAIDEKVAAHYIEKIPIQILFDEERDLKENLDLIIKLQIESVRNRLDKVEEEKEGEQDQIGRIEYLEGINHQLLQTIDTYAAQRAIIWGMFAILDNVVREGNSWFSREHIRDIVALLLRNKETAFNFSKNESYEFSVYYYDKSDEELRLYYRDSNERIIADQNRSIINDMVVHCFGEEIPILITNLGDAFADNLAYIRRITFRSLIISPILVGSRTVNGDSAWGALAVSSSEIGQFDQNHLMFLWEFCRVLSILFL